MNVKRVKRGTIKPVAPFTTLKEEAAYWDANSVLADVDEHAIIGFHRADKSDTLTIRFTKDDLRLLRERAGQKGIGASTLVRMWIKERLTSSQ